jgi:hypothetical protein
VLDPIYTDNVDAEPKWFAAARAVFLSLVSGLTIVPTNSTDSDGIIAKVDDELRVVQAALVVWYTAAYADFSASQSEHDFPDLALSAAFEKLPSAQARFVRTVGRMLSIRAGTCRPSRHNLSMFVPQPRSTRNG